jgi:lipopolysaccharide biosynthesis glycosyltransferase
LSQKSIAVACGADANYAMQLTVTLFSLLSNLRPGVDAQVHVLDGGIGEADKAKISRILSKTPPKTTVSFLTVDLAQFSGFYTDTVLSSAAYMRLLLPELLPDLDSILYLDSDIVVRADVSPLFDEPLEDAVVLAVPDTYGLIREGGRVFFNSGVLLMNLAAIRREGLVRPMLQYLLGHPKSADQESLNTVLADRWRALDYVWNFQTGHLLYDTMADGEIKSRLQKDGREGILRKAAIIHFAGHKPWNSCLRHPFRPLYHDYLRRSGWFSPVEFAKWGSDVLLQCALPQAGNAPAPRSGPNRSSRPLRDPSGMAVRSVRDYRHRRCCKRRTRPQPGAPTRMERDRLPDRQSGRRALVLAWG